MTPRSNTAVRLHAAAGASLEEIAARARDLGLLGWIREAGDGGLQIHAEGDATSLEQLVASVHGTATDAKVEGHEQFAIRGVSAGEFTVLEHPGPPRQFELRLEVGGQTRSWTVPKGPSLDPSVKRFAIESANVDADEHALEWDRGSYEQGGRVPWPEALDRGHAVFVLHGDKLRGGFALQRTRTAPKPQWLLVKRRDEHARPASEEHG